MSDKCKYYRKSEDKKYDYFCEHFNAPLCGDCSNCDYYEERQETEVRLIDANALKETIVDLHHRSKEYSEADEAINNIIEAICDDIDNAPIVETFTKDEYEGAYLRGYVDSAKVNERPKGKWTTDEKGYFYCDRCGKYPHDQYSTTDFCPKCGADMRGGTE